MSADLLGRLILAAGVVVAGLVGLVSLRGRIAAQRHDRRRRAATETPGSVAGATSRRIDVDSPRRGETGAPGGSTTSRSPRSAMTAPASAGAAASSSTGYALPLGGTGMRHHLARLTAAVLGRRGWDRRLAAALEAAGIRRSPVQVAQRMALAVLAAATIGYLLLGFIGLVLFAAIVVVVIRLQLSVRADRRRTAFAEQLPDTLELVAASLRAGTSLIQATDGVASDASPPASDEFRRVMTEQWLGRDLVAALKDIATRMRSADFSWAVGAIEIHREVGGDLADVLDRVAETIRTRNRVRGQVQVLTAEGRLSAWILCGLPPAMFLAISLLNPTYIRELTDHVAGVAMLGTSLGLLLIGLFWMRRIIRMDL